MSLLIVFYIKYTKKKIEEVKRKVTKENTIVYIITLVYNNII